MKRGRGKEKGKGQSIVFENEGGINGVPSNIRIPAPKYFVQSAKAYVSICECIFIGLALAEIQG